MNEEELKENNTAQDGKQSNVGGAVGNLLKDEARKHFNRKEKRN